MAPLETSNQRRPFSIRFSLFNKWISTDVNNRVDAREKVVVFCQLSDIRRAVRVDGAAVVRFIRSTRLGLDFVYLCTLAI